MIMSYYLKAAIGCTPLPGEEPVYIIRTLYVVYFMLENLQKVLFQQSSPLNSDALYNTPCEPIHT